MSLTGVGTPSGLPSRGIAPLIASISPRRRARKSSSIDGRAFGIVTVTPDEGLIRSFEVKAASLGYEAQYRGVRVTPGDPKELVQSPDELDAALAEAVRASIDEDGAQAVIMGGGPLSASAVRLQPQFDVPLVVAVSAAARAAVRALQKGG